MLKKKQNALADKTNLSSSTGKSFIKSPPSKTALNLEEPSSDPIVFDIDGNAVSSRDAALSTFKEILEENRLVILV